MVRRAVIAENCSHPQTSSCGICGGQSVTEICFRRVLLFTPVSIISSILRTQSFICHRRCENLSIDGLVNITLKPGD